MDLQGDKLEVQSLDSAANVVEVKGLQGKTITNVRYQFANKRILVSDAGGNLYCVKEDGTSVDLGLTFQGYAGNVNPVISRPYVIINTSTGAYVIDQECNKAKVSDNPVFVLLGLDANGQNVRAINNTFAIVQENGVPDPQVFVVKSDLTVNTVIGTGSATKNAPVLLVDNTATRPPNAYNAFIVGDAADASNNIQFIDRNGDIITLATSQSIAGLGIITAIQEDANGNYHIAMVDGAFSKIQGYYVVGNSLLNAHTIAAEMMEPTDAIRIEDIDFDASGTLFAAIRCIDADGGIDFGGLCNKLGAPAAANAAHDGVFSFDYNFNYQDSANLVTTRSDAAGPDVNGNGTPDGVIWDVIGAANGALVFNDIGETAYLFLSGGNLNGVDLSNTGGNPVVHGSGAVTAPNNPTCAGPAGVASNTFAPNYVATGPAPARIRVKNTRTTSPIVGFINSAAFNWFYSFTLPGSATVSCAAANLPFTVGEAFSPNLDRWMTDAFVINNFSGTPNALAHFTASGAVNKVNVNETNFGGNACGAAGALVQRISPTQRVCLSAIAGGFAVNHIDYGSDALIATPVVGTIAGLSGNAFGDVYNDNPSLFGYMDAAANRGTVSYCPSSSTYEYFIAGSNVVNFRDEWCFIGFASPNGAYNVPFIK